MTIQRIEHVGIVVDDLAAATAFSRPRPTPENSLVQVLTGVANRRAVVARNGSGPR